RTQTTDLTGNVTARLFFPFPDFFDELFTAQVMTANAFCTKLTFYHHLGGNTGMVSTRLPKRIFTRHTVKTRQGIHDGIVKTMTHVQATSDVWWRNHDTERFAFFRRLKVTTLFPSLVPFFLDLGRIVGCRDILR